ncbi:hypothetical protein MPH_13783 [Macrophomina phaseolina MS6]|uniref:Uncharacterized protein n=1 Tax=Macrophomina phaseolina (strain MS6) TaxID=1126212 RepID=K2QHH0_MACPH|nr:hypothetical protein MPH_13783 [Macrophomina phaseolina MS6]
MLEAAPYIRLPKLADAGKPAGGKFSNKQSDITLPMSSNCCVGAVALWRAEADEAVVSTSVMLRLVCRHIEQLAALSLRPTSWSHWPRASLSVSAHLPGYRAWIRMWVTRARDTAMSPALPGDRNTHRHGSFIVRPIESEHPR